MAKTQNKRVSEVRQLFHLANNWTRKQWEKINQRGFFKIGWDLCVHCYDREVNMEHDRQERIEERKTK